MNRLLLGVLLSIVGVSVALDRYNTVTRKPGTYGSVYSGGKGPAIAPIHSGGQGGYKPHPHGGQGGFNPNHEVTCLGLGCTSGGQGGFAPGHHGGHGGYQPRAKCQFWCKDKALNKYYCCDDKLGRCPPVRAVCPQHNRFGPPTPCSNDGNCAGADKCCFDKCLKEKVCKAPLPNIIY